MELRSWLLRGTLVGLVVLGAGGRILMRVMALALVYLAIIDAMGRRRNRV